MAEEKALTERNQITEEKPRRTLTGALKMVKGENTARLIENFTSEMTLVAEGLCEDQSKLRREAEQMKTEEDRRFQRMESKIDIVETSMDEERESHDRDLTELRSRLAAIEKKMPRETSKAKKRDRNIIRDLTWLVGVAGASWIIVTIINKFF